MRIFTIFSCLMCLTAACLAQAQSPSPTMNPKVAPSEAPFDVNRPENSPEIRAFMTRVAAEQGVDVSVLKTLFAHAQWSQRSLDLTQPTRNTDKPRPRKRNWPNYRQRFLSEPRLGYALDFGLLHGDSLRRAEQTYGVPASIILSILNIESRYGAQTGRYNALDVLATLAFYHSTRREFFQQELASLIRLWRAGQVDIFQLQSSYAGALGMGQFMPSSVLAYALDFNGDGTLHLEDAEDAIGSVAQFLQRHGWKHVQNTTSLLQPFNINPVANQLPIAQWLAAGPKPNVSRKTLEDALNATDLSTQPKLAAAVQQAIATVDFPVALVDLPGPAGDEFRLGGWNYYVITRYNRSFDYATAVVDLARAIECAWRLSSSTPSRGLYSCLSTE